MHGHGHAVSAEHERLFPLMHAKAVVGLWGKVQAADRRHAYFVYVKSENENTFR